MKMKTFVKSMSGKKKKKKELKEMVKKEEKKRGRSVFYSHKKVNEIVILSHNEIMS